MNRSSSKWLRPLPLTARLGGCFLVILITVWVISLLADGPTSAASLAADRPQEEKPESGFALSFAAGDLPMTLGWVWLVATSALCGLVGVGSARTMSVIETQLRRLADSPDRSTASGDPVGASHEDPSAGGDSSDRAGASAPTSAELPAGARPIIGSDPAVIGFNRLLALAVQREPAPALRTTVDLDDVAVTMARAMRVLPAAWTVTDVDGRVHQASPHAQRLLRVESLQDQSMCQLLQLEDVKPEDGVVDDASATERLLGPVRRVEIRHRLSIDGAPMDLNVTRCRLQGRGGDCEGMVWLLEDITAQQAAVRTRDEFLLTATHELRTPLTNLRAYAETLRDEHDVDVEQQREFCSVIVSESIRLGRLVDQLLSMGQLEAGSMLIDRRELDLHTILEDVRHQVSGQADEKQLVLHFDVAAKLPTITGDRDKLQAALINLIGNAVKYTPSSGQVIFRCQPARSEDAGPHHGGAGGERSSDAAALDPEKWIQIDVVDTGPGISPEDQPRVFEKFYRCSTTADAQRGNGLGLSLAREIARLHGGDITLLSELGEGSRFTMTLPVTGSARSGV